MSHLACAIVLLCFGMPALPGTAANAQTQAPPATETSEHSDKDQPPPPSKFTLGGDTLYYDTEKPGQETEITGADVDELLELLQANKGLTTLSLNSGGGSVWAAEEMARIVIDFELDTLVEGECSSSCVRIFLGGMGRAMSRGSKIGFHSRHWSPDAIQRYYEEWREDKGWDSPFEFVSWVYRDTYAEAYEDITWSMARGVTPKFSVEMHAPRESMWFPTRAELQTGGLLRD